MTSSLDRHMQGIERSSSSSSSESVQYTPNSSPLKNNPQGPASIPRPNSKTGESRALDAQGTASSEVAENQPQTSSTASKRYICPICSKRFYRLRSLNIHVKIHARATSFRCPYPNYGRKFNVYLGHTPHGLSRAQPVERRRCCRRPHDPDSVRGPSGQPQRNDGFRHHHRHRRHQPISRSHGPYTRSRPENEDTRVAFPSRKSQLRSSTPMPIVSSPSRSDTDSRLGITPRRRRKSTDSTSELSSSPASCSSFDNFSNMSSVTSNSVRSSVDHPFSNYSSCNKDNLPSNAQSNESNSNGMAKAFSTWSNWPSPTAANENRSRPGSAQSGSSGGRSDSP